MKVQLIWEYNRLLVKPWIPGLVSILTAKRRVQDTKSRYRVHREPLYDVSTEPDGSLTGLTYGGLLERVWRFLLEAGHLPELINLQPPLPEPAWIPSAEELRPGQAELIASIASSVQGGVIESPTGSGKTFVMEALCRMYASHRILITTRRRALLKQLYDRVTASNPDRMICYVDGSHPPVENADIAVCSAMSLHKIDPDWPDTLFFDECHNAAAPTICQKLGQFWKPRIFGFSASPKGRGDGADLILEAMVGPVIHTVDYQSAVESGLIVPIDVWLIPSGGSPKNIRNSRARDMVLIWRNRERNRKLADMVNLFSPSTRVLIMVKSVEHGLRLRQLLPDFELVFDSITEERRQQLAGWGLMDPDGPLETDMDWYAQAFRSGEVTKIIVTDAWQEGLDIPELFVMARADGQGGDIPSTQMGGRLSRNTGRAEKGILIDFDDDDIGMKNRTDKRLRRYRKHGWEIYRTTPEEVRNRLRRQGLSTISL